MNWLKFKRTNKTKYPFSSCDLYYSCDDYYCGYWSCLWIYSVHAAVASDRVVLCSCGRAAAVVVVVVAAAAVARLYERVCVRPCAAPLSCDGFRCDRDGVQWLPEWNWRLPRHRPWSTGADQTVPTSLPVSQSLRRSSAFPDRQPAILSDCKTNVHAILKILT